MSDSKMIEKAKCSSSFCIYPFSHLATKTDGTFKLCCRSLPISNVRDESLTEVWNGEKYKSIRRQMLNGEKPKECEDCWELEEFGTRSMRQRALNEQHSASRWNRYKHLLDKCSEDGHVDYTPHSIELKLSNLCNLRCRMCHPVDSTSWAKDWPAVEGLMKDHNAWTYKAARFHDVVNNPVISEFQDNERWWSEFDDLVDNVDLIEFAGGEPLIDPLHYRILERLKRRAGDISLKYSTNLTRTKFKDHDVFDYWTKFASVSIYASIDGLGEVYEYIRTGAKFKSVIENLQAIRNNKSVRIDEFAVACTIQMYNAFQMPEVIDFFVDLGVRVHTHRVISPSFLNVQVLPPAIKARLTEQMLSYQETLVKKAEPAVVAHLKKHIGDHLKHMNGKDRSEKLLGPFIEFTQKLDKARNTDVLKAVPELREIFLNAAKLQSKTFAASPAEVEHLLPKTTSSP